MIYGLVQANLLIMNPYFPELFARPAPRYTSYPTAVEFREDVGADDLGHALDQISAALPLSLYVHIPFCEQICWYCGCNTGAANKATRLDAYMDALEQEIIAVAARLKGRGIVKHIAFGGGSPNALAPIRFIRLLDMMLMRFSASDARVSVELDPRGMDRKWVRALSGAAISRVSLGVQTFAPHIQQAINRVQPYEQIAQLVESLRAGGIASINFDLMYGLPLQSMDDLSQSIEQAVALGPDRLAVFGYAHLPDVIPRQKRINTQDLPDQTMRFNQAQLALSKLTGEGYRAFGIDHFARPHDPLAKAAADGRLRRNFQGYTDDDAPVLLGFGASAISSFPDLLVQNEKNSGRYRMRVSAGGLPVARGIRRTAEDKARAAIIEDILCRGQSQVDAHGQHYLNDASAFEGGLSALAPFERLGLVKRAGAEVQLEDHAWPYARLIAQCFDAYRIQSSGRFSSAI